MNNDENDLAFRVWVGCMGCYNGGDLIGQWFDAEDAPDEIDAFNKAIGTAGLTVNHFAEAHEELWCYDVEAPIEEWRRDMSPSTAKALAEAWESLADDLGDDVPAYMAWVTDRYRPEASEICDYVDDFRDAYCGEWDSRRDYAENLAEELDLVPKEHSWPASYIDWNSATRDLFMDYSAYDNPDGGIWVFRD